MDAQYNRFYWDYELEDGCSGLMWCAVVGCRWQYRIICSDLDSDGVADQMYQRHWDAVHAG